MSRRVLVLAVALSVAVGGTAVVVIAQDGNQPATTSPAPTPAVTADDGSNEKGVDGGDEDTDDEVGGGLGDLLGSNFGDLIRCAQASRPPPGELFSSDEGGGSPQGEVRSIARVVERLRGLHFAEPVDAEFVGTKTFNARIREQFRREYSTATARVDAMILTSLGVLDAGTDLRALAEELLEGQAAGFYLPASGELVVREDRDPRLDALEKVTLSHELEHALADQVLGLPLTGHTDPMAADQALARLALVEGDASLLMQHYMLTLPLAEQLGLAFDPTVFASTDALDDVPHFVARSLIFPYVEGLGFACDLYARGGWAAVDRAYANPPDSTAEVLFPRRYRTGFEPVVPRQPDPPSEEWRLEHTQSFGPAELLWLFEAPGNDPTRALNDPLQRVAAWRGGRLTLWTRGEDVALELRLVQGDGLDLCHSVSEWYQRSHPDDLYTSPSHSSTDQVFVTDGSAKDAALYCANDDVRLGIAPDGRTAMALAGPLGGNPLK